MEAQLCGVPVVAPDAGAFAETGALCHTLADYCHGVQLAIDSKFDRAHIRQRAVQRYDMYNVARKYDYAFKCIADLRGKGVVRRRNASWKNRRKMRNIPLQIKLPIARRRQQHANKTPIKI